MRSSSVIRAELDERIGSSVLSELRGEAPLAIYPGRRGLPEAVVWIVGSAGGPLGGDDVELDIEVGEGASLRIGSVAASIALAADASPSRTCIRAHVGPGASLIWTPEPLVVTQRANHVIDTRINISPHASLWWREDVILGRAGEQPGCARLILNADLAGSPWLRHTMAVGTPGWDGPAGIGGARAISTLLHIGRSDPLIRVPTSGNVRVSTFALSPGGTITAVLASDHRSAARVLPMPVADPQGASALQRSGMYTQE